MSASPMNCRCTPISLARIYASLLGETLTPMGGVPCMYVILAGKSSAAGGDTRTKWYGLSSRLFHCTHIFVRSRFKVGRIRILRPGILCSEPLETFFTLLVSVRPECQESRRLLGLLGYWPSQTTARVADLGSM